MPTHCVHWWAFDGRNFVPGCSSSSSRSSLIETLICNIHINHAGFFRGNQLGMTPRVHRDILLLPFQKLASLDNLVPCVCCILNMSRLTFAKPSHRWFKIEFWEPLEMHRASEYLKEPISENFTHDFYNSFWISGWRWKKVLIMPVPLITSIFGHQCNDFKLITLADGRQDCVTASNKSGTRCTVTYAYCGKGLG